MNESISVPKESYLVALLKLSYVLLLLMLCGSSSQWVGLQCVDVVFPDHTDLLFE